MKTSYTYAQIGKVAYPIFITFLVQNLIQVIDTAFLGRVGEVELGASAIAGIFYIALFTIAFGFSTGSQILIGRRNGERNYDRIGEIVIFGSLFLLVMAGLIFLVTRLFAAPILGAILASPNILEASLSYLDWRIYGLFFSTVSVMIRAFFVGITRTKVLTLNAIVMALTNVFFDYVLIFGKWGFPEMGIAGAALASVIAEAASILFYLIYMRLSVDLRKYGFFAINLQRFAVIRNILSVSLSLMLQQFLSLSTWLMFFVAIEWMGETPLAISNIIRSCFMILIIPVNSLSATTSTLVSNSIGNGKQDEVLSLIWKVIKLSLALMVALAALCALFPHAILNIYTSDSSLITASIPTFYALLCSLPVMAIGYVLFNAVSGTGNTAAALRIEIGAILIYCAWIYLTAIRLQAALPICWLVEWTYACCLGVFGVLYLRRGKWKNKQI